MQDDKAKFKEKFVERLIAFSVEILGLARDLGTKRRLWPISDQLIRSSTSIGANVVEAKASSSKREYIKYFEIALKSANETIYWLMVIERSDVFPDAEKKSKKLLTEVQEIARILGSSVLTLKGKR